MAIGCGLDLSVCDPDDFDEIDFSQSAQLDRFYCVAIDVASGECIEEGDNDLLEISSSFSKPGKTTVFLEAYISAIAQRQMWSERCKSNDFLVRTWVLRTYEQRTCFMDWYANPFLCNRLGNLLSYYCTTFCEVLDGEFQASLRFASQQCFLAEPLLAFVILEYNVKQFRVLFFKFLTNEDLEMSKVIERGSTYRFNAGSRRDRVFKSFLFNVIKKLKVFAINWNDTSYRERSDQRLDFARVF